ncbi:MAG: restriction endonuclease subunit S [Patescibacteria group bacterium]|nr:restriction endonuclease subunit S [Patescibacteria group bacterium]
MKQEIKERVERIRRGEVPEGYQKTKVGIIPEDWLVSFTDDVAKRGTGHTPNKQFPSYYNGGIKWISLQDSNKLDNGLIFHTKVEISEEGLSNSSAVLHSKGSVLISRDAGVGKSAIMGNEMAVSQHFITWTCSNKLNNWYLYYYLQNRKREFERIAVGSTIKTIGMPFFKKYKIPLPPIKEQDKIAEILSTWDKAIELKEKLIEENKKLKKEAEKLLITGDVRFFSFNNEWSEMRIKDFTIQKPSMRSAGDLNETGLYPVYGASGIAGYDDTFDNDEEYVAIIKDGSGVGRVSLYKKKTSAIGTLTTIKANEKSDIGFVYLLMKNINYKKYITGNAIPHIYYKDYSKENVKMPSLEEQRKIAHFSKIFNQYIQNLEKELNQLKEQKRGLMQLLLTGIVRVEGH